MKKNKLSGFTLVEIMIVVAIIGLLAAIAIPNFFKARENARTKSCINNLRLIDAAKQQWAIEMSKPTAAIPNKSSLIAYIGRPSAVDLPHCPDDLTEDYFINNVSTPPACPSVFTNHSLSN